MLLELGINLFSRNGNNKIARHIAKDDIIKLFIIKEEKRYFRGYFAKLRFPCMHTLDS